MTRMVKLFGAGVVALLLSSGAIAADSSMVTPAQVAAATTAADHEAIAKEYDAEAATAEAAAKKHEAMVQSYEVAARSPKNTLAGSMVQHCRNLVKDYQSAAADYKALAAEHRKMAEECCHSH